MKVVIAHKYFYPRDGVTTHVFDLIDLLESHGHTVIPFAMKHPDANFQFPISNFQCKELYEKYQQFFVSYIDFNNLQGIRKKIKAFFRMLYSFEAKKKFKKLILHERPDIVHIHNIYHHLSPSILDVCKDFKIPVVHTVHDYKLICPNYKLFARGKVDEGCIKGNYFHDAWTGSIKCSVVSGIADALEMIIHRAFGLYRNRINRWIVPSRIVAQKLIEGGLPKKSITVINHFISEKDLPDSRSSTLNLAIEDPRSSSERSALVKSDRTDNRKYLLCVGRLSEEKGFDVAIKAMEHLPDCIVNIVGDGPARALLEQLAANLGLGDRVRFAGYRSREEVIRLMAFAHLTLVPSLWHEPFGYVVLESLAVGTPVIGSDRGALPELLKPISDDLIVPAGDSQALAARIEHLLADTSRLPNLSIKGRNNVHAHYSPEGYYTSLMDAYARCLTE